MTNDPDAAASAFYRALERAWNEGDGAAWGAVFAPDSLFVDNRGLIHDGGPETIGADHQGIFDTLYKGSTIQYAVDTARALSDGVILARGRATLDVPTGPIAGTHRAVNTIVLVRGDDDWRAVSFHNTLVTA